MQYRYRQDISIGSHQTPRLAPTSQSLPRTSVQSHSAGSMKSIPGRRANPWSPLASGSARNPTACRGKGDHRSDRNHHFGCRTFVIIVHLLAEVLHTEADDLGAGSQNFQGVCHFQPAGCCQEGQDGRHLGSGVRQQEGRRLLGNVAHLVEYDAGF